MATLILNLGTSWMWVVNFTSRLIYSQGKSSPYAFYKRLDGPQIWCWSGGENRKSVPLPGIEPWSYWLSYPARFKSGSPDFVAFLQSNQSESRALPWNTSRPPPSKSLPFWLQEYFPVYSVSLEATLLAANTVSLNNLRTNETESK
jgi:hypothetical protein